MRQADWEEHARAVWEVLRLYQGIRRRFRRRATPIPIVVMQAADASLDQAVCATVERLRHLYERGGLLCGQVDLDAEPRPAAPLLPLPASGPAGPAGAPGPGAGAGAADLAGGLPAAGGPAGQPGKLSGYYRALAMVRILADARDADDASWANVRRSKYRRYAFPRSRLLAAIETAYEQCRPAVPAAGQPIPTPDPADVLRLLRSWAWRRPRPASAWRELTPGALIGPATIAGSVLAALIGVLAGHLPVRVAAAIAAGILLLAVLVRAARLSLSPLSSLTQASRWFATTTFLIPTTLPGRPAGPSRMPWRSADDRRARTRQVIEQLIIAEGGGGPADPQKQEWAWQFCLQLRVLALLEDLRACYRRSPDLRRHKRGCPPLAILAGASERNGGLVLVQAISDVRSRRSEQDPLLVIAAVPSESDLTQHRGYRPDWIEPGLSYEAWATAMRVDQSPSLGSAWPWVLRYRITPQELTPAREAVALPRAGRPLWTRAWSGWALLMVTVLAAAGLGAARASAQGQAARQEADRARQLARLYCGGDLARAPHYLVHSAQSPGQCVGIDTSGWPEFVPRDGGVQLSGAAPGTTGGAAVGTGISLASLERGILAQNRAAERARQHVTVVWAGGLTSSSDTPAGEMQAAGAARELAGLYAFQAYVNRHLPVLMRVDIANGGQDLASQVVMAQKIAAAARHDRSIVGVIGLGRDTPTSAQAVRELGSAGLAIIDTTNSDDSLGGYWNYFGLAATNAEEASALRAKVAGLAGRHAVIFVRQDGDTYSDQQAAAARAMLRGAGFQLAGGGTLPYPVTGDEPDFSGFLRQDSQVCAGRPSVVYLAGRSDDLASLMYLLQHLPGDCLAPHVVVLSGDDLTKSEVTGIANLSIPPNVTIYFAALTDVAQTAPGSGLAEDVQAAFRLPATPPYADDPFFADGSVALAFDAAQVLYQAAGEAGWHSAPVASWLRCMHFTGGATGQIWFSGERHGVDIVRIAAAPDGSPEPSPLPYVAETGPASSGPPCS